MNRAPRESSWDPAWEKVFQSQEWGKYPPEYVIRFVATRFQMAEDRSRMRILDMGCGTGACTIYMAKEGFSVAAIDGSETGLMIARRRLEDEGLKGDLRQGDFVQMPWPDATFDGVVDNVSLYCNRFPECLQAVSEVHRILKPGGWFLSCSFTDRTMGFGLGREIEPGTFTDIREGPLAGKGVSLFMNRSRIDRLYRVFESVTVEKMSRTIGGMTHLIEHWLVECQKEA